MLNFKKLTNSNRGGANYKGFTLIELLAVIVILAVVALVATPIIITSVSKAKESAATSSALGYIDGINKSIELQAIESVGLENGFYTLEDLESLKNQGKLSDDIKIQGNTPTAGWVLVQGNSVTQYSLIIDGYRVSEIRNIDENTTTKTVVKVDDNTELLDQPNFYISNPSAVYLDPTDLSKTCTESDSVSTTETKSGCMKWYVYYNDGYDAKLLLDHNTTARLAFSATDLSGSDMVDEIMARLAFDTWNNPDYKWQISKEKISVLGAEEIAKITGKENWDSTSTSNYFFFDGLGKSKTVTYSESSRNPYAWLYNNTYYCADGPEQTGIDYGCTIEDNNETNWAKKKIGENTFEDFSGPYKFIGYWTNSDIASYSYVWFVSREGSLKYDLANSMVYGIRPVITISSSLID